MTLVVLVSSIDLMIIINAVTVGVKAPHLRFSRSSKFVSQKVVSLWECLDHNRRVVIFDSSALLIT